MGSSTAYASRALTYARLKGQENEQRVYAALADPSWRKPNWLRDWREPTLDEDMNGTDLVLYTTFGLVRIQIKGSRHWALKFLRRYVGSDIRVIIVHRTDGPEALRRKLLEEVAIARRIHNGWPNRCSGHRHANRRRRHRCGCRR